MQETLSIDTNIQKAAHQLSEELVKSELFVQAKQAVVEFMQNDEAVGLYENTRQLSQALVQKQRDGLIVSEEDHAEYEAARSEMMLNSKCEGFMDAQLQLRDLESYLGQFISMTLQSGEVPSHSEVEAAVFSDSGCCGGNGGGSCGCG
ncbi:MAG: YlbF family regulator [Verrucomicrobiales bacterium]